jgi:hypothetical protein
MNNRIIGKLKLETPKVFVVGVVLLVVLLYLPPGSKEGFAYRAAISAVAAMIGAMIPGMLTINVKGGKGFAIRATGAMAIFVIVYLINPGKW